MASMKVPTESLGVGYRLPKGFARVTDTGQSVTFIVSAVRVE